MTRSCKPTVPEYWASWAAIAQTIFDIGTRQRKSELQRRLYGWRRGSADVLRFGTHPYRVGYSSGLPLGLAGRTSRLWLLRGSDL